MSIKSDAMLWGDLRRSNDASCCYFALANLWSLTLSGSWPWGIQVRDQSAHTNTLGHRLDGSVLSGPWCASCNLQDAVLSHGYKTQVAKCRRLVMLANCNLQVACVEEDYSLIAIWHFTSMLQQYLNVESEEASSRLYDFIRYSSF